MSWMSKAFETYEKNESIVGKVQEGEIPLFPVAHMMLKAQLEVTITQDGEFFCAEEIDKKNADTIIPVTEASGGRSNSPAPHPLNDTLSYIAGDYSQYSNHDFKERFQLYQADLEKWAASEYCHPKVKAVCRYISRQELIQDLIACRKLKPDAEGHIDKVRIQDKECEKILVRFRVIDAANPVEAGTTWEDRGLMKAFTDYYLANLKGKEDICYLTGKKAIISQNHPKGILPGDYGAKLITANDLVNFTYRGRFINASESCAVSYEASQKAHAALAWLVRKQGVVIGNKDTRTYICWTTEGKKIEEFHRNLEFEDDEEDKEEEDESQGQGQEYRASLKKAFQGHVAQLLDAKEDILITGLDAATKGRLSVTYYNEVKASDFAEHINYWESSLRWLFINGKSGKTVIKTPPICLIIKAAYGTEHGNDLELDERIMKVQAERLISCMVQKNAIPFDLVHAVFIKASFPQSYKNWWNREIVLSTACALTAKYNYYDKNMQKGECFEMALNERETDRSYLFGRLLAVYEKIESYSLYLKEETRETNAIRLQSAFVSHPMATWKIMEESVNPCFQQLSGNVVGYYKKKLERISELITENQEDIESLNRPLTELYLLGYYLQRAELNRNEKNK